MKKWITIILCFGMFIIGFSQKQTAMGFRSGVNLSNLSNFNLDTKTGFYLGFFANIRVSEVYAFQPELGYSNQGGDSNLLLMNDVDIHYITLALTNKFFVSDTGFHFIMAPGFDFDADDSFIGLINNPEGNDATFIDVNMGLGIGFEFKNGLGLEARYKQGFIDVYSGTFHNFNSPQLNNENQLNTVYQLGMFYKFKL